MPLGDVNKDIVEITRYTSFFFFLQPQVICYYFKKETKGNINSGRFLNQFNTIIHLKKKFSHKHSLTKLVVSYLHSIILALLNVNLRFNNVTSET